MRKLLIVLSLILTLSLALVGCTAGVDNNLGECIITAENALTEVENGAILVDAQNNSDVYAEKHVLDSVSITRGMITTYEPVLNSVISKDAFEEVMMNTGIANDSMVIIYDDNRTMDSGRLFWTMLVYGHENVKVVSGGLEALINAGAVTGKEIPVVNQTDYTATELNTKYLATIDDVIDQLNYPDVNVHLIDVRSQEEYDAGTIPSSILIPFDKNLFYDGTFKPMQQISILYKENGIDKDDTVIMFCKSSVRGAQTFLAMFNAGYENVKLYDGAYLEWSSDKALPIQMPEGTPVISNQQDNS
ncbi:MAG: rhodanese-like domain-containing protein [Bacillota bacterium]|nr:rhodanese-like domain-containing protein [Bacillota bacterium]